MAPARNVKHCELLFFTKAARGPVNPATTSESPTAITPERLNQRHD